MEMAPSGLPSPSRPAREPRSVAVADLDADSVPDLVTANVRGDDVSVLLGNGDGTFQTAVSHPAGDGPRSVAVADLDGDTIPDVVTANVDSDYVSVLLGNGDGTFQAAVFFAAGAEQRSVAAVDLDGDTIPDVVTANADNDNVSVLLNQCDHVPPLTALRLVWRFALGLLLGCSALVRGGARPPPGSA